MRRSNVSDASPSGHMEPVPTHCCMAPIGEAAASPCSSESSVVPERDPSGSLPPPKWKRGSHYRLPSPAAQTLPLSSHVSHEQAPSQLLPPPSRHSAGFVLDVTRPVHYAGKHNPRTLLPTIAALFVPFTGEDDRASVQEPSSGTLSLLRVL